MSRERVERATAQLFGDLWSRYDDRLFKESVELFECRWRENGEPPDHFQGKRCLDAGCGGGRYSFAMAQMGAAEVVGVDVGEEGLVDAQRRAEAIGATNLEFRQASALDLPFERAEFDFVCCCGVLHHTPGVERGLRELVRVLRPGGSVYLLLYGAGGLYWPLNLVTRPLAEALGQPEVDRAIAAAGLAANKRRTILDDLFVPILETYTGDRVDHLLRDAGFASWRRWTGGQNDHESDPSTLVDELRIKEAMWEAGAASAADEATAETERCLAVMTRDVVAVAETVIAQGVAGGLTDAQVREAIIGTGHHRIVAEKPAD
ncbi:MAG: class I SAM-dependent methyltransferase [Solirubrobacteraceae bacterium]